LPHVNPGAGEFLFVKLTTTLTKKMQSYQAISSKVRKVSVVSVPFFKGGKYIIYKR